MDEAAIVLDPVLRKCWMKRGQQRRIDMPPSAPPAEHLFGGYNWRDSTVSYCFAERRTSEGFIAWLEHLMLTRYPTQQVILVMDNAGCHKSRASYAAIALFEARLLVVFLPAYAPHLNPIERYWRHLKDQVCADKLYPNAEALRDALVKELARQNDPTYSSRLVM